MKQKLLGFSSVNLHDSHLFSKIGPKSIFPDVATKLPLLAFFITWFSRHDVSIKLDTGRHTRLDSAVLDCRWLVNADISAQHRLVRDSSAPLGCAAVYCLSTQAHDPQAMYLSLGIIASNQSQAGIWHIPPMAVTMVWLNYSCQAGSWNLPVKASTVIWLYEQHSLILGYLLEIATQRFHGGEPTRQCTTANKSEATDWVSLLFCMPGTGYWFQACTKWHWLEEKIG